MNIAYFIRLTGALIILFATLPELHSQATDLDLLLNKYKVPEGSSNYKAEQCCHAGDVRAEKSHGNNNSGFLFKFYKRSISNQISSLCQYEPSCSEFSFRLMKEYGFFKGLFLSTDRLARCNHLSLLDVPPYKFCPLDDKIYESVSIYRWKEK